MSVMVRIQSVWTGFQGSPGYTNMYFLSDGDAVAAANSAAPRVRTFWAALAALFNSQVHIDVQKLYQVLDSVSGHITAEQNLTTTPTQVVGTGTGSYASSVGAAITWETGMFNSLGHRVRGRTYVVPLNGGFFSSDGTPNDTNLTTIETAAAALIATSPLLLVWTRPTSATSNDGTARTVTGVRVSDKAAVLRSRRD